MYEPMLRLGYGALVVFGLAAIVDHLRWRSAWRRLAIHVFTQHPIVNPTPPSVPELDTPAWIVDTEQSPDCDEWRPSGYLTLGST